MSLKISFKEDKENNTVKVSGDTFNFIKLFKAFGGSYNVIEKFWVLNFGDKLKNVQELQKYIEAINQKNENATKLKWKKACHLNDSKFVAKTNSDLYEKVLQTFKDLPTLTE